MADNVYMYSISYGKSINGAVDAVKTYFHSENMETQYFLRNECHIVQARAKSGKLKQFVGMDKAIEVRLTPSTITIWLPWKSAEPSGQTRLLLWQYPCLFCGRLPSPPVLVFAVKPR